MKITKTTLHNTDNKVNKLVTVFAALFLQPRQPCNWSKTGPRQKF